MISHWPPTPGSGDPLLFWELGAPPGLDVMRILKVHVDAPARDIPPPPMHLKIGS